MSYSYQRSYDANSGAAQSGVTATCVLTGALSGEQAFLNVMVSSDTRTISSFVDSAGSTWVNTPDIETDGSNIKLLQYFCTNLLGNAPTVTVTFDSAAANNVFIFGDGYSGLVSPIDQANGNGVTGTNTTGAISITTLVSPAILYAAGISSNGANARPITTPAGMTRRCNFGIGANPSQRCTYDVELLSTGAQSVTFAVTGGNSSIIGIIDNFPESGGGGGGGSIIGLDIRRIDNPLIRL